MSHVAADLRHGLVLVDHERAPRCPEAAHGHIGQTQALAVLLVVRCDLVDVERTCDATCLANGIEPLHGLFRNGQDPLGEFGLRGNYYLLSVDELNSALNLYGANLPVEVLPREGT